MQGRKHNQRRSLARAVEYQQRTKLLQPGYATEPVRPGYQRDPGQIRAVLPHQTRVYEAHLLRQIALTARVPAVLPVPDWTSRPSSPVDPGTPLGSFSPEHESDIRDYDAHRPPQRRPLSSSGDTYFSYVSNIDSRSDPATRSRTQEGPWKPARIASPTKVVAPVIRPRSIFSPPGTPVRPTASRRDKQPTTPDDLRAIFEDVLDIPILLSPIGSTPSPSLRQRAHPYKPMRAERIKRKLKELF